MPHSTTTEIGGQVARRLIDSLTGGNVLTGYTYDSGVWSIEEHGDKIRLAYREDGFSEFDFEEALKEAGVPFDRCQIWDLGDEFNSYEMLAFRPGFGEVSAWFNGEGGASTATSSVREIIENPNLDPQATVERLRDLDGVKMERFLEEHPLPTLEIVEDQAKVVPAT